MKPAHAILLSIFVLACAAYGATKLSINADTRVFFSDRNANRQALDMFEARYASAMNLLIVLHAEEGDVFTEKRLQVLEAMTDGAWVLPYAVRVESIINAANVSADEEGIVIEDTASLKAAGDAANAHARAMADPLLVGRILARDGKTTAINVTVDAPMSSSTANSDILAAARTLAQDAGAGEAGLDVWYGGRVATSNAFSTASKNDLKTLIPLAGLLFLMLMTLLLRSPWLAGLLFVTTLCAAVSAMGLAGWLGFQINAATSQTPTIIIALGIACFSHLVMSVRRHMRAGDAVRIAVDKAVVSDARPIALSLGTTGVGFLTLLFADAPPFRELGVLIACGAAFSLFYGLVLLPALLRLAPLGVQRRSVFLERLIDRAGKLTVERRKTLLIGVPAASVIAMGGLAFITIDDTFPKYFDHRFEFRQHADLIEEHLTGLEVLEFDVDGGAADAIFNDAYVEKLAAFEAWLEDQPKVAHVGSVLEIYRRLHQHMNEGDASMYVVPKDKALLAQYMLLYEMSLPMGQELTNAVTIDKARSRVTAIMRGASTGEVRRLRERAEIWLDTEYSPSVTGTGTGIAVMFAYLSSLNVSSMLGGTLVALAIISFILIGAFRSLRYGLLSLAPNLAPGLAAFGIWGYLVGEIGVAVSVVGAMTLGIIVDDTIHLIFRYREARRRGAAPADAAQAMFAKVGEPMLVSTIALVSGFLLLATSGFHITSSMGMLVAGAVAIALLLDWFLLTPLLITSDRHTMAPARPALRLVEAEPAALADDSVREPVAVNE
ncbi:MAG: MMPL family transporter [Pseudomonadota bacterium]